MSAPHPYDASLLATRAAIADPYPFYRHLRDASPVRYQARFVGSPEPSWLFALLRFADVTAALRDPATFSSDTYEWAKQPPRAALLQDDPPRHTHLRRMVSKAFTPRRVAELEPWIAAVAGELADEMGRGEVELMNAFAVPLPMRVIARLLGVPAAEVPRFRRLSTALASSSPRSKDERDRSIQELTEYFQAAIADPGLRDGDDLIATLLEADADGVCLQEAEVLSMCFLLLIAGNETTTGLLGNMLGVLADRPELWQRARDDRSLVEPIIAEVLRFESPVQRLLRITTRPVELSGVLIGERELVSLYFGAANRDPEVFAEPDTFRVDRPRAEHVAFGAGIHSCLGAPLARAEARIALHALLDRFPTLSRGREPAERQTSAAVSFAYQRLPLAVGI